MLMSSGFRDPNSIDIIIKMDECHRKGRKGGGLALIAKCNVRVKGGA